MRSGKLAKSRYGLPLAMALGMVWALLCGVAVAADDDPVKTTPFAFSATVNDDIEVVQESLVSALQGRNYMIVNVLDVQQGLKNKNIQADPILLVEFINLTKAYVVTQSNEGFELFAPLRAALFQRGDDVLVLMLRPEFVRSTLQSSGLSSKASAMLDELENDAREIMKIVASGGF